MCLVVNTNTSRNSAIDNAEKREWEKTWLVIMIIIIITAIDCVNGQ